MAILAVLIIPEHDTVEEPKSVRMDPGRRRSIGRSRSNDIELAAARVSGTHAEIRVQDGRLWVRDAGSRNGTWITGADDARRLTPGQEIALEPQDSIRIGPYRLVPCEMLREGVVLSSQVLVSEVTRCGGDTMDLPATTARDEEAQGAAALRTLVAALRRDPDGGPCALWGAILKSLLDLMGAQRGFLLSPENRRFLLRASIGDGCISQRFLEETASRGRAWSLNPAEGSTDAVSSASLLGFADDITLVGVPFKSRNGKTLAVGYLERTSTTIEPAENVADIFASVAGPILELADALDRETRRRQALERREPGEIDKGGSPTNDHRVTLIGNDPRFRDAVETIERAAGTDASVLVRGPSGSGKEQLANLTHDASRRSEQPFVVLNCAALPETLIESELFGVDKGAYTGADRARPGAFAQAHRGTLFLDEIGDLHLAAQAKILRVIETGEVVRVGGSRERVDVRLVTATHRDLEAMVKEGTFREDLYYRLRVIEVNLPPLAERPGDILPLAELFLQLCRKPDERRVQGISVGAADRLTHYGWPGNVRELRNVIDRATILDTDGVLDLDDLPAEIRVGTPTRKGGAGAGVTGFLSLAWPEARDRFEKAYFQAALERNAGAVQKTAKATGVDRRTLSTKIARHGLRKRSD